MNFTVEQKASADDKKRNEMIILVYNSYETGTIIKNPSNKIKSNYLFNSDSLEI